MAKYSDIKGFTVQTLSTDTIASAIDGGSWASGGDLNTQRRGMGGAGTANTALLASAGDSPPGSGGPFSVLNEQYNGTSWTEVADLNLGRKFVGDGGTQTAAIIYGGRKQTPATESNDTEIWNGSGWTEVNNLNEAKQLVGSAGTSTANLCFGGADTGTLATTESWDGTNWTEVNDLNTARYNLAGTGTSTAALATPGGNPIVTATESWDGTSWTEIADLNTARQGLGASGSYTDSLVYGGESPITGKTEFWNGSTWTEVADLSIARETGGTGRQLSTSEAVFFGGDGPGAGPRAVATEEWDAPATFNQIQEGQLFFNSTTNTFKETISDVPGTSWSSGPSVNSSKSFNNGAGDLTSSITFGGAPAPTQAYAEQWNGSTWTEVADLNEGRAAGAGGGASGTDAILAGGYELPNIGNSVNTEIWNGSSWTEVNNLNAQKYTSGSGIPVSTSGIAFGGNPVVATAEVWDGTNWTEVGDLNTARMYLGGFGSATSAIAANGVNPGASPSYTQNVVEKWDGTSWTEVSEMNTARGEMLQGQGSSNASGIISGGSTTGSNQIDNTEIWNGSSWTELNDLGTAKRMGAQIGSTSSGMYIAGQAPSPSTSVEHWNSPLANKTITAS